MEGLFKFDITQLGPFALMVLIPGIVEAAKQHFGVSGRGAFALAACLGIFFGGLATAINEALIPAWLYPWLSVFVVSLSAGLAASGFYDLVLKPFKMFLQNGSKK